MNPGAQLAVAVWAITALVFILVVLRLYTRTCIVRFIGLEDHMYAGTWVFLFFFAIFLQLSVLSGLGRDAWELSVEGASKTIFCAFLANGFSILGNAVAKLSLGLFLVRVVQIRWHKIALWVAAAAVTSASVALSVMLWNQAAVAKASADPRPVLEEWIVKIQPMSVAVGVVSSVCDFFFAAFPWLFVWSLNMSRKERIMLAGSMSLGVIAGGCGIARTVFVSQLGAHNYTMHSVSYFAWSGVEIAVAMLCIGGPTLRPLYLRSRGKRGSWDLHHRNNNNNDGNNRRGHVNGLPGFDICDQKQFDYDGDSAVDIPPPPPPPSSSHSAHAVAAPAPARSLLKPTPTYVVSKPLPACPEAGPGAGGGSGGVDSGRLSRGGVWVRNSIRIESHFAEWPLRRRSRGV